MIQIYAPSNTNFSKNGTSLLPTSCTLSMQINGTWSVFIENALDDRFQNIVENAVLSAPTPYGQQLFRITQMDKSDTGVSATAVPIFLDAQNDTFIYDQRPTDKTGQQALDILMDGTKYTGHSDITTLNTAYYQMKNLIECLASDDENSFLNRWGGEIRFDDYDIYINERLGADNGARVEFGFNLSSIQESIDMSSVVTKIVPVAYNGYTLPDGETVNSPNINKYPIHYIRTIHYDDIKLAEDATDGEEDVTVCDTLDELYQALRTRAAAEYDSGIDLPSITYQVNMVDLAKTEEYAAFKGLVTVNLGDTVHIKHRRLDIETQARIVALEYDCIQQKVTSLTIGDSAQNYFDKTSDIANAAGQVIDTSTNTLMANRIAGVINLLNASLRAQKNVAQRQDVRAILFEDLDESSPTYGALCIGTQGIQIAKERNAEGTDWKWGTAIDFRSVNADYIITGILTDRNGKFYFNLDTGELRMKDGTFAGSIIGASISGGTISGTTINGGTISGSTINGGTINGTSINTDQDLTVGNNIYINTDVQTQKYIYFTDNSFIRMFLTSGWEYLVMESNYRTSLRSTGVGQSANGQASVYTWTTEDNIIHSGMDASNGSGTSCSFILQGENGNIVLFANGTFSGNVQYTVSSDKRLKENIEDIDLTGLLDIINVKKFNMINNPQKTVGVIAQDFIGTPYEDIILRKDENGYYSVDYNVILMAIVQKLKEVMEDDNTDQNRAAFDA